MALLCRNERVFTLEMPFDLQAVSPLLAFPCKWHGGQSGENNTFCSTNGSWKTNSKALSGRLFKSWGLDVRSFSQSLADIGLMVLFANRIPG